MNRRRNERRSVGTSNGERRRTACLPAAARYFRPRSNIRRKRGRIEYRFDFTTWLVRIIYGTVADVARYTCLFSYVELETIVENGG